jgi:uncharacterized membrane protein (UPF0127 family)
VNFITEGLVTVRIINQTKGTTLAESTDIANSKKQKAFGLLVRKSLPAGEALLIPKCYSIHTFFMRFPIDVVFLTKENRIIKQYENVVPFRIARAGKKADSVLELPAHTLAKTNTAVGDVLHMTKN